MLLAIANQKRSIRGERDAFRRNQTFVFAGHESRRAVGSKFPKATGIVIGKEYVVLRIDNEIFRRLRAKARIDQRLQTILLSPGFERDAALVREIKFSLVPEDSIRRSEFDLIVVRKKHSFVRLVRHDDQTFLLNVAGSQKDESAGNNPSAY